MSFDSHFVIKPFGTEKTVGSQKNDVNISHKLAFYTSRGIGSSHMGPYLENKVVGQDNSFIILENYRYFGSLVQMSIIIKKSDILKCSLWPSFLKTWLEFFSMLYSFRIKQFHLNVTL